MAAVDGGLLTFNAQYFGGGLSGIFKSTGQGVSALVLQNLPAPEQSFYAFGDPAVSHGTIAFFAEYGSFGAKDGIFTTADGAPVPIIKTGDSHFGGTISALKFVRFGLDDDGSGRIAFLYQLADGRKGFAMGIDLAADFDEDAKVDQIDLGRWRTNFAATGVARPQGDADSDADVDGADVLLWQRQLGTR